jgi:ligand-binding sensor domain-containing protein
MDILQDEKGFMWFSARNGLYRFDGYQFTSFKPDIKNDHSLSDVWISALFEDSDGILYAGTWDQGLNIYNSKKENFIRYKSNKRKNSIASDRIRCIKEDSKGIIWIGTADKGFFSFNKKQKKFTTFSLPPNCANNCLDMVVDKDGNIWMINSSLDIFQFNTKTKQFDVVNKSFSSTQNSDEIIYRLLLDKKGQAMDRHQYFWIVLL